MSKILAINEASQQAVEMVQIETLKEEYRALVQTDPEIRAAMITRVKEIIAGMSAWDVAYHAGFNDAAAAILRQPEMKEAMESAMNRVLADPNHGLNYQIIQATGEYLAGRITMKLEGEKS